MLFVLCLVIGYALGNIHPSIIISKSVIKKDIRDFGSGNAGAANMLRTFGFMFGVTTFLLDAVKGALAFLIGFWLGGLAGNELWGAAIGGVAVVLGHDWPAVYKFKGGKGIACSVGIMLIAKPDIALVALVCALAVILLTKFVSVGSLLSVLMFAMYALLQLPVQIKLLGFALLVLALIRHADNLKRLASDSETRVSFKNHRV